MTSQSGFAVRFWTLDRIKPYPKNARKIPASAIELVARSLQEFGWRQPIVVDTEGAIIVGHVRLAAATRLGWAEAPVHVAENLTPAQIRAYRLMDNRSHDEAKWDLDILALELKDLSQMSLSMDLTGFSAAELDRALVKETDGENDIPPMPVTTAARTGDVWLLGPHRITCGDCTEKDVEVMRWQKLSGAPAVLEGDGRTFAEIGTARNAAPQETPVVLPPTHATSSRAQGETWDA